MPIPLCVFRCLALLAWLFIGSYCYAGQLYIVSLKTGEIRQLTDDENLGFGCPDWSPDSQRIALDASPIHLDFLQSKILIVDCQEGSTKDIGHGAMPDWSPDGKRVVCHTFQPSATMGFTTQIVVLEADGSGSEVIIEGWGAPRWNPEGSSIVSTYQGGLARFDFKTGKQTLLLDNYGVFPGFSYSGVSHRFCVSSGSSLAIVEEEAATEKWLLRERYSKKLTGNVQRTFPRDRKNEIGRTSWAPDGQRFVFAIGDPKTDRRLFILNADDTLPPTGVPGLPADWICCNPSWSPDGEWVAFIRVIPGKEMKEE